MEKSCQHPIINLLKKSSCFRSGEFFRVKDDNASMIELSLIFSLFSISIARNSFTRMCCINVLEPSNDQVKVMVLLFSDELDLTVS